MGDEGIFATTAEVQRKVTAFADATPNSEAYINQFMAEAESLINNVTGFNWSDVYGTLNVDVKEILQMTASAKAAMLVINYNTSKFPSVRLAEFAMDVLDDEYNKGVAQLKTNDTKKFIRDA